MDINEIRQLSLEYAKGNMKTGEAFRGPKVKPERKQTYAEWFAKSLQIGRRAGKAPHGGNPPPPKWSREAQAQNDRNRALGKPAWNVRQLDDYKRQDAGDDGLPPW